MFDNVRLNTEDTLNNTCSNSVHAHTTKYIGNDCVKRNVDNDIVNVMTTTTTTTNRSPQTTSKKNRSIA